MIVKEKLLNSKLLRAGLALLLVLMLAVAMYPAQSAVHEFFPTLYIGMIGEAGAETADFQCDGVDDHVQFQAALDALPSGGGKIYQLSGSYDFDAIVTRAIDNVTIQGNGRSSYTANNGSTALFSDSGQSNWIFVNLATDAGGITKTGTSSYIVDCWIGTTYTDDSGQRTATIVVAANSSPQAGKDRADYVCNASNDQVELQAAIDEAYNSGSGYGVVLLLSTPTTRFQVNGDLTIKEGVILRGLGPRMTGIELLGASDSVILQGHTTSPSNSLAAKLQDISIAAGHASHTGGVVVMDFTDVHVEGATELISNVVIGGQSGSTGLYFRVNAVTEHTYISRCHFGPIFVAGCDIGLEVYVEGTDTEAIHGWISGNVFEYFQSLDCTTAIQVDLASSSRNHFLENSLKQVNVQGATTGVLLEADTGIRWNSIWMSAHLSAGQKAFDVSAGPVENFFFVSCGSENYDYTDNGTDTRIIDVRSGTLDGLFFDVDKTHLSQDFGASGVRLRNTLISAMAGEIIRLEGPTAQSGFVGKIDSGGSGGLTSTNVPYDTDSFDTMFIGLEAYNGTTYWGQIILHNTTRSNSRKIVDVDPTTNVITTTASTDDWADTDDITVQSQTCSLSLQMDIDLSAKIGTGVDSILIWILLDDMSSTPLLSRFVMFHPYETYDQGKRHWVLANLADQRVMVIVPLQVINQKITIGWGDGGTINVIASVKGTVEFADVP